MKPYFVKVEPLKGCLQTVASAILADVELGFQPGGKNVESLARRNRNQIAMGMATLADKLSAPTFNAENAKNAKIRREKAGVGHDRSKKPLRSSAIFAPSALKGFLQVVRRHKICASCGDFYG